MNAWRDFKGGKWQDRIDVRDFIQKNYTPYTGDESFLQPPTARTEKMLEKYEALCRAEQQNGGVLNIDTETVITATSFGPGYLDKENEIIVGLQTDEPLKRACNPFGGMRMVRSACEAYGYKVSDKIEEEFKYHKTHNDGVFSAYTDDVRAARHAGIITGLPDAYGRGRIIGDYRRVAALRRKPFDSPKAERIKPTSAKIPSRPIPFAFPKKSPTRSPRSRTW